VNRLIDAKGRVLAQYTDEALAEDRPGRGYCGEVRELLLTVPAVARQNVAAEATRRSTQTRTRYRRSPSTGFNQKTGMMERESEYVRDPVECLREVIAEAGWAQLS
jgi:hypothetical protein